MRSCGWVSRAVPEPGQPGEEHQRRHRRLGEGGRFLSGSSRRLISYQWLGTMQFILAKSTLRDDRDTALRLFLLVNLIAERANSSPRKWRRSRGRYPRRTGKKIERRDGTAATMAEELPMPHGEGLWPQEPTTGSARLMTSCTARHSHVQVLEQTESHPSRRTWTAAGREPDRSASWWPSGTAGLSRGSGGTVDVVTVMPGKRRPVTVVRPGGRDLRRYGSRAAQPPGGAWNGRRLTAHWETVR